MLEKLELTAGQFNQIDGAKNGEQSLINTNFGSYNFCVFNGVTYEIVLNLQNMMRMVNK